MDALLEMIPDEAFYGAVVALAGLVWPVLKAVSAALQKRVERWGDRDRHSKVEEADVERVVEKVRKNSFLAKTLPAGMVRDAVVRHRSSDPPPMPK